MLDKMCSFGLELEGIHILSASHLVHHRVMAQHYGLLTRLAENAERNMPAPMRFRFREAFGVEVGAVCVLGGFELLRQLPEMNPLSLDLLWSNVEHWRLGSGCFCGNIRVGNELIYLINGFMPRQLESYTSPNHALAVFVLAGDGRWVDARTRFLGNNDPTKAIAGSLRNEFLLHRTRFGFRNVSLATNGAHLSAGPVEALIELRRFTSDCGSQRPRPLSDFQFGRKLVHRFTPEEIEAIFTNPVVWIDGKERLVFELTESVDEDDALELLASLRTQLGYGHPPKR